MLTDFEYSLISTEDDHSLDIKFRVSGIDYVHHTSGKGSIAKSYYSSYDTGFKIENGFFHSLISSSEHKISSGILPPAIKYYYPGAIVFERPPCYQVVQYIPHTVEGMNGEDWDEEDEIQVYRIPIPWQLYIIEYDAKNFICNNVRMFFMKSSLNSVDQNVYMPPLPNFYTGGQLCRPMFSSYSELDHYSKDVSGVIASAHDWIWNSGFNHDLTENIFQVACQRAPREFALNLMLDTVSSSFWRSISPKTIHGLLKQWESYPLEEILNLNWPNPSLNKTFDSDANWYTSEGSGRFDIEAEDDNDYLSQLGSLHNIEQTYADIVYHMAHNNQSSLFINNRNFDRDLINAISKIKIIHEKTSN